MIWMCKRPFVHAPLVAAMLAGLLGVACEPDPEAQPGPGARRQLPPPDAEYVTDPYTGRQLRRNPNRRVLGPGGQLPEGVLALERPGRVATSTFTDASGRVHAQVVECFDSNLNARREIAFICETDPAFVVVGGGARTENTEQGALLIESRPIDRNLFGWVASSQEHGKFDSHGLRVWAIGLRLDGVSDSQLWQHTTMLSEPSPVAEPHPSWLRLVGNRHTVVGGGAAMQFNYDPNTCLGNLLTASIPEGTGWRASGKDHAFSCPANAVPFVIGLRPFIDGFGPLEIIRESRPQFFNISGRRSITATIPSAYVPAGIGGQTRWTGQGRLLWEISPGNRSATVSDKDHLTKSEDTTLEAHIIGIRAL